LPGSIKHAIVHVPVQLTSKSGAKQEIVNINVHDGKIVPCELRQT
jgi:hypothetical protein